MNYSYWREIPAAPAVPPIGYPPFKKISTNEQ